MKDSFSLLDSLNNDTPVVSTFKVTSPGSTLEIYIFKVSFDPGFIRLYSKYGPGDSVGVMSQSAIENLLHQNWKLEKWHHSDEAFKDFSYKIILDIFDIFS